MRAGCWWARLRARIPHVMSLKQPDLLRFALVGLGGGIGAVLRYVISGYVQQLSPGAAFPLGTVAVNLVGCFFIGALSQLADAHGIFTTESRVFVFTGILGGYTTFSTFANETINLMREGQSGGALLNVVIQVSLGLAAVFLGRMVAGWLWRAV